MSRWREVDRSMTEAIQLSIDDINAVLATPSDSLVADLADAGQVDAEMRERSRDAGRIVMTSEDAREGPLAFVQKRDPVWKGR